MNKSKAFVVINIDDKYFVDFKKSGNGAVFTKDVFYAKFYKDKSQAIFTKEKLDKIEFELKGEYGNYKIAQVKFSVNILN